jgi:hypothetical protein
MSSKSYLSGQEPFRKSSLRNSSGLPAPSPLPVFQPNFNLYTNVPPPLRPVSRYIVVVGALENKSSDTLPSTRIFRKRCQRRRNTSATRNPHAHGLTKQYFYLCLGLQILTNPCTLQKYILPTTCGDTSGSLPSVEILPVRVSSKQTKINFGSNRNKPKQDLFRVCFGLFRETKNKFFRFDSVFRTYIETTETNRIVL